MSHGPFPSCYGKGSCFIVLASILPPCDRKLNITQVWNYSNNECCAVPVISAIARNKRSTNEQKSHMEPACFWFKLWSANKQEFIITLSFCNSINLNWLNSIMTIIRIKQELLYTIFLTLGVTRERKLNRSQKTQLLYVDDCLSPWLMWQAGLVHHMKYEIGWGHRWQPCHKASVRMTGPKTLVCYTDISVANRTVQALAAAGPKDGGRVNNLAVAICWG